MDSFKADIEQKIDAKRIGPRTGIFKGQEFSGQSSYNFFDDGTNWVMLDRYGLGNLGLVPFKTGTTRALEVANGPPGTWAFGRALNTCGN